MVCHLTTGHRPDDMRIARKECATLAAAGYDVRLVVPTDEDPDLAPGIRLVRVRKPATRGQRLLHARRRVLRAALGQDADVYHVHDVDLLPVALALKARGKRVVYDAHEDFPKQVRRMTSIRRPLRMPASLLVAALERLVVASVDAIVAATPAIASRFPPGKTWVVQNYPLAGELESVAGAPYATRARRVIYAGGFSPSRGALEMVRAMEGFPSGDDGAELVLCGTIQPAGLKAAMQAEPGWSRVREAGWLGRSELMAEYGGARVGLVVLHPSPQYVESQPVKLFEYMAAGLPVVASDFPLWRGIVDGARCGLLVDPLDPKAIAAAVRWLLDHPAEAQAMGERGRQAVREKYTWATEGHTLLEAYARLVGPSPAAHS